MTKSPPKVKYKKCKVCGERFAYFNSTQKVCGAACALTYARQEARRKEAKQERQKRAELRERKQALKTIPDLIKEAQAAVNAWVRWRDAGKDCICCPGKPLPIEALGGAFDAGHYRSRGAAGHLRFNLWNIHGQSKACNRYQSGNANDYRIGLINRIGIEKVEWLESNNEVTRFEREYLIRIRDIFRRKLNAAKRRESRL